MCICRDMHKTYRSELDAKDRGKLIDRLESRAETSETTVGYHFAGESPPNFIEEKCYHGDKAKTIASHYRSVVAEIRQQGEAQS
jgi:hypothetical protein